MASTLQKSEVVKYFKINLKKYCKSTCKYYHTINETSCKKQTQIKMILKMINLIVSYLLFIMIALFII